jgi:hypothetical protein
MLRWFLALLVVGIAGWMTAEAGRATAALVDLPFDYDEAIHALPAYQAARDLSRADPVGFSGTALSRTAWRPIRSCTPGSWRPS